MLVLQGEEIDKVDQAQLPPELLMEQMLLRESLEELSDDDSALDELTSIKKAVQEKMQSCQQRFAEAIIRTDKSSQASGVRPLYHELQFLQKALHEIDLAEEHHLGY